MGVLLDGQKGELDGDTKFGAAALLATMLSSSCRRCQNEYVLRDVGLLVTQTHGSDKPLVLDRATGEIAADKSGLGDHALPGLLVRLLSGVDHLEHLLLADTLNLGQRHGEFGRLLSTLILDSTRQCLGVGGLRSVEQVLGKRGLGGLVGRGGLDVLLLLLLDALLHLDLLLVALLLVQLGPQTTQVLRILGLLVTLTGLTFALLLIVIEPFSVLLLPALNVPRSG